MIKKDFGLANGPKFSMDITPLELKNILHEKIYFLLIERFQDYLNPSVRSADIPEGEIKRQFPRMPLTFPRKSAFGAQAEWQKVWYKAKYSS
ncbi:MAG: hypothetical protein R2819_08365 [Allomuricauda sp.]